jgi:hypothetical protein
MKKVVITGIVLLVLSGTWGIAQEATKERQSGMPGMMTQESKPDEGSEGMMQGMHGMMGMMMKMMEQCNDMMKAAQQQRQNATPTQKN